MREIQNYYRLLSLERAPVLYFHFLSRLLTDMYQEFAARDTKGSGYINSNLLAECIKSMGISILDEDVVYLKKHFDINGKRRVIK